jgi:triacylglycerol lipase
MHTNIVLKIFLTATLLGFYIYCQIKPRADNAPSQKLKILIGGYELICIAIICLISECLLYIGLCFVLKPNISTAMMVMNAILSVVFILIMLVNGFVRIFTTSSQLGAGLRLCLLLLWWIPIVNIILFYKYCQVARLEYTFECKKHLRNMRRKDEKICKTKYPILMVHGIFFRDWKLFGYWGRIPNELMNNGAVIYYGNQQSSSSIEQSAAEIKQRILEIVAQSGCEKMNVIAHSKGGLDMRYAISCLDMGDYVASLTTINTPHRGCNFAGKIIAKAPKKLVSALGKKYDSLYTRLGDDKPDFFSGVSELTAEKCAELNKKMPDSEGVVYQSVGSKMHSRFSAVFPLNVGYSMIKPLDGDNDGLVATSAMVWGNYLGTLTAPGKRGISHGDMIDLTRKNIYGFDVCEFYVNLVKELKDKGL